MNPFDPGYWTETELSGFGFRCGKDVRVEKSCTIISKTYDNISFGDHVRVDGFCTIVAANGYLKVGSHVHIAGYNYISCGGGVTFEDFAGFAQGGRLYSQTDDYLGAALTGPTIPPHLTKLHTAPVRFGRHVVVGGGCTILPGVDIGEGTTVGAMSLINRSLDPWGVYFGVPARRVRARSKAMLAMEPELMAIEGPLPKT